MASFEEQLKERIGAILHRLSVLEQGLSSTEPRKTADKLVMEVHKISAELERAFVDVQQTASSCVELRSSADNACYRADLLFEMSPTPTLLIERSGSVVDANPSAARAVNTSHRHLIGKPFQLYMAANRDALLARLKSLVRGEPPVRWPVTIRPRERSPMQVVLAAAVDSEDRLVVMLLAPEAAELDSVRDFDDELNARLA
jgi:PAS domain-containing protein